MICDSQMYVRKVWPYFENIVLHIDLVDIT